MKQITIIITALNEGREPLNTIESIYKTADPKLFKIILFNDGTPKKDWVDIPKKYKEVTVIHNRTRKGIQWCRNDGARMADTSYIAIFNARMRFVDGWLDTVLSYLKKYPKTLFCTTSVVLYNDKDTDFKDKKRRYGAEILQYYKDDEREVIFQVQWTKEQDAKCYDIPAVLGANYFTSKKWWNTIEGLEGLFNYGSCEEFISLKTWAFGGKVKIIKEVEVANIYREVKPYPDNIEDIIWNKLFVAFTLLDWERAYTIMHKFKYSELFGKHDSLIRARLIKNMPEIIERRTHFKKKTVQNIEHLIIKK